MTDAANIYSLLEDYHLLSFDALDSTNAEARRLAASGGAHGAVIWAQEQTEGRGRRGREWISPVGNLYVSFLLKPEIVQSRFPELAFVAAMAVRDTVVSVLDGLGCNVTLKWPNDVLVNEHKLAGVLLESITYGKHNWAVCGIGINVEHAPVLLPQDTQYACDPTSFKQLGLEIISPKIVLSRVIHYFIQRYDSWAASASLQPLLDEWQLHAWCIGKDVCLHEGERILHGIYVGLDETGALMLQTADGMERIVAGEFSLRAPNAGSDIQLKE